MMKRLRLPIPIAVLMRFAESAFPKRHPFFNGEGQIAGRGEQVQMIGHQNIIPNQPSGGLTPCIREQVMRLIASQPGRAVLRAGCYEDNGRLMRVNENSLSRFAASQSFLWRGMVHGSAVGRGSSRAGDGIWGKGMAPRERRPTEAHRAINPVVGRGSCRAGDGTWGKGMAPRERRPTEAHRAINPVVGRGSSRAGVATWGRGMAPRERRPTDGEWFNTRNPFGVFRGS